MDAKRINLLRKMCFYCKTCKIIIRILFFIVTKWLFLIKWNHYFTQILEKEFHKKFSFFFFFLKKRIWHIYLLYIVRNKSNNYFLKTVLFILFFKFILHIIWKVIFKNSQLRNNLLAFFFSLLINLYCNFYKM